MERPHLRNAQAEHGTLGILGCSMGNDYRVEGRDFKEAGRLVRFGYVTARLD